VATARRQTSRRSRWLPMSSPADRHSPAPREREVIRFQTMTGSVYEVARSSEGMRWQRITATFASGVLRNEGARLLEWPVIRVGQSCLLRSEPFAQPDSRVVWTSQVVAILEYSTEALGDPAPGPYRAVKVGDRVTRLLAGSIPMRLVVTHVDDRFIYCGGPGGWKFDLDTGDEVDEEIGWGPQFGLTGSFLLPEVEEPK
jgi:hypothetical protein